MHMNKVLVIKFRLKKKARKMWKQGWAIQEEHKETVQHCRDGVRKAKSPPDAGCERRQERPLQVLRQQKEGQGKHRPVPKWGRGAADKGQRKGQGINAFFTLVFACIPFLNTPLYSLQKPR